MRGVAMRSIRIFPVLLVGAIALSGAGEASAAMLAGVDALKEWNLIVFNNMTTSHDVEGRAFVGGDLSGNSGTFYNNPGNNPSQNNNPALTVVGNVSGSTRNINNSGGANIGGNLTSQNGFNLNGTQTSTWIASRAV
jgi:choice-of-anchor A domain-containing protein